MMDQAEINAALKDMGLTVEDAKDEQMDFPPLAGAYKARIAEISRRSGTSERTGNDYDFYSIKFQILEVVEGDPGVNRYVDKTYSMTDYVSEQFSVTKEDNIQKLINDLYNCGVDLVKAREGITIMGEVFTDGVALVEAAIPFSIDLECSLRLWVTKKGKQTVKVVKEIKAETTTLPENPTF